MEYFVTGATGFIGSYVVDALVEDGHDVVAPTRSRSNAADLPDVVTVVEGDITAKETMEGAMAGVDGVSHTGGSDLLGDMRVLFSIARWKHRSSVIIGATDAEGKFSRSCNNSLLRGRSNPDRQRKSDTRRG